MKTISGIITFTISLIVISQTSAQNMLNYKTVFPAGIFVGYGLGSYSVKDEYISREIYSGTLPCFNIKWVRFPDKNAYRLDFEYRNSSEISNNKISAKVGQFTFNQDFIYAIGTVSLFSRSIYAYLGPSVQVFYYDINYHFATPGNIGYIYIGSFNVDDLIDPFYQALNYVKDTKGLILDIRHNNGGSSEHTETIINRFITAPLEKPKSYLLGKLILSAPFKPQGPFPYLQPVVVLINGVCASAADLFPEVMKQISTVTVVGDTTAGASAGATLEFPAQYELPSGKKVFIGTLDLRRYDGLPWEWIGIAPDVRIEQTEKDMLAGRDKQLEYAIVLLK